MTENNNIVIYQSEDGKVHLDVVYNEETMWLAAVEQSPRLSARYLPHRTG